MKKNNEINYDDLSNGKVVDGKWVGRGIFDKLMSVVNDNIELQYTEGRLTGPDYAKVYMGSIQEVIRESLAFLLQKKVVEKGLIEQDINIEAKETELDQMKQKWEVDKEILDNTKLLSDSEVEYKPKVYDRELDYKDAQIAKMTKDAESTDAQIALYERQTLGFEENKNQKLLEAQLNAWAIVYSAGRLEMAPAIIDNDAATKLYQTLTDTYTPNP